MILTKYKILINTFMVYSDFVFFLFLQLQSYIYRNKRLYFTVFVFYDENLLKTRSIISLRLTRWVSAFEIYFSLFSLTYRLSFVSTPSPYINSLLPLFNQTTSIPSSFSVSCLKQYAFTVLR
jgi:hypothetical protein